MRLGTRDQVPLQVVNAQIEHGAQLRFGLHPFGNHANAAVMSVSHQVAGNVLLVLLAVDSSNDACVKLHEVNVVVQQGRLPVVSAAEIVHGKAAPKRRASASLYTAISRL